MKNLILSLWALLIFGACDSQMAMPVEPDFYSCTFVFTDCYPDNPCEGPDFRIEKIFILEGLGIFMETSVPYSRIEELAITQPSPAYSLPFELVESQYYEAAGGGYFIIIPIPEAHYFWEIYSAAIAAGRLAWSGNIRYNCQQQVNTDENREIIDQKQ